MRPLELAPRPGARFVFAEAFFADAFFADAFFADAGAFRAVDLDVDRREGARFVEVPLAGDFCADAFFVDLDFGGLA